MKTTTQIDWREWRDTRIAFEKLNQLLSHFGIQLNHSADLASDFFEVEAGLRSLGSTSYEGAPRTAAKLEETASLYPDQEHNVLVAFALKLECEAAAWAQSANNADDRLKRALTAYDDIMGQIRAMKERSDLYFKDAEAGSDEAEKHLRVFNVLKELERLGESFRNR